MTPSRYCFSRALVDRVAGAVECFCSARSARGPRALARVFARKMTRRQRANLLFFCGSGDCGLLQFFHASGVLHHPAIPGMAWLIGGWLVVSELPRWAARSVVPGLMSSAVLVCDQCDHRRCRIRVVMVLQATNSWNRNLSDLLKKQSSGLCTYPSATSWI